LLYAVLSASTLSFISTPPPAYALLVYSNDFQGGIGTEWSSAVTETTPAGSRTFLGQFDNAVVSLTLPLPAHAGVIVSFDLFILQSWDGNDTTFGPDLWELTVDGGPTPLHTTFSNAFASEPLFRQAYPDAFPGGDHPGLTGTAESNTLGYSDISGYSGANDSVYQLTFALPHSASSLVLHFSGAGLEGIGDESWGLDNVRIDVTSAPEPNTLCLVGTVLVGFSVIRWQPKHKARTA
jgi:hypothetical protein